ncbi:uncharacterized protein LOC122404160 [Colletes gigas]|uniref:uncharacterized protein LOC122404160 n=1 Tax=Colletes gigas TaxID=935657 RepID=UPI001C9AD756|nr:uncharacterized protein LOC122404160 [Colletes gigas]
MDKLRFEIGVKAGQDLKSNIYAITSIGTPRGEVYGVSEEHQAAAYHTELIKTEAFKRAKATLKLRHQSRKIWIKLDKELRKFYMDEEENIILWDYYLEEITSKSQPISNLTEDTLSRILGAVFKKDEEHKPQSGRHNLKNVTEKFIIEKFTGKNANGIQWLDTFEKECNRLGIQKDEEKIEIFRLFLEGSCLDWYSSMLIKHSLASQWETWKDNFCETYADKGWSPVKYAILYRYINGSLLDYALKKERILLEMNKSIDKCTLIDLIAVGLPDFIMDKIDRKKLKDTEDLFNGLRSLEHMAKKKNTEIRTMNKYTKEDPKKKQQKRACRICEKEGKMNRFHPESSCWFKGNENIGREKNQIKFVNNAEIETELSDEEQKNL